MILKVLTKHPFLSIIAVFGAVILAYSFYAWSPQFPADLPSAEKKQAHHFSTQEQTALETLIKTHFLSAHGDLLSSESITDSDPESLQIQQTYLKIHEQKLLNAAQSLARQKGFILKVQKATTPNLQEPIFQFQFLYNHSLRAEVSIFLSDDSPLPIQGRIISIIETEVALLADSGIGEDPKGVQLVIIIDDLGQNYKQFLKLTALNKNFTFSILPELPYTQKTIATADELGLEVMLHIPMQPQGWPKINPGKGALFVDAAPSKNQSTLLTHLEQNPAAKGANNHMGSAFTQSKTGMEMVMEALSQKGMYFLDSKTAAGKISKEAAAKFGVPFLQRDYFLDNVQDVEKIQEQLQKAAALALKRGWAIVICHPYPTTFEALQLELENLKLQGINITRASKLLKS